MKHRTHRYRGEVSARVARKLQRDFERSLRAVTESIEQDRRNAQRVRDIAGAAIAAACRPCCAGCLKAAV